MIDIVNKMVAIILVILSLNFYIMWLISKEDYYHKQAIYFAMLAIVNIIV